jgi:hypothetical protein
MFLIKNKINNKSKDLFPKYKNRNVKTHFCIPPQPSDLLHKNLTNYTLNYIDRKCSESSDILEAVYDLENETDVSELSLIIIVLSIITYIIYHNKK